MLLDALLEHGGRMISPGSGASLRPQRRAAPS
jgi:hypothetical protein